MDFIIPISATDIFDDVSDDFSVLKSLLASLNKTDCLLWCGRLNLILSNRSIGNSEKQHYIARNFLKPEEARRLDVFSHKNGGNRRIAILSRSSLLELIRWLCLFSPDAPDELRTFESEEIRSRFIRAAVISGSLWGKRIHKHGIISDRHKYLTWMRKNINENTTAPDFTRSVARGRILLGQHLPQHYGNFERDFFDRTNLSLNDYYIAISTILSQSTVVTPDMVVETNEKCGGFNLDNLCDNMTEMGKSIFNHYLIIDSQTPDELTNALLNQFDEIKDPDQDIDLSGIFLDRPIIRTIGKVRMGMVLDPVVLDERAQLGPFWTVVRSSSDSVGNNLRRLLGEAFEKNYAYNCIEKMFTGNTRSIEWQHDAKADNTINSEEVQISDFLMRDRYSLALIEAKASLILDDKLNIDVPGRYVREVLNKYGRIANPVGVGQLCNSICELASGNWKPYEFSIGDIYRIYPVLLVLDDFIANRGHIRLLAEKFVDGLKPDYIFPLQKSMKKGEFTIMPLIVMSIDEMENLENAPRDFNFLQFLLDYSDFAKGQCHSVTEFVGQSQGQYSFFYNQTIVNNFVELGKNAINKLFPSQTTEDKEPKAG